MEVRTDDRKVDQDHQGIDRPKEIIQKMKSMEVINIQTIKEIVTVGLNPRF